MKINLDNYRMLILRTLQHSKHLLQSFREFSETLNPMSTFVCIS